MEAALVGWRGFDRSRMPVTSLVLQQSPASSGLLRFLAMPSHSVAALGLGHRVVGRSPTWPLAVADNGAAFGITSLVGGNVVRPLYPLRVWLKTLGSPVSIDDICGCRFPAWRHRCGKPTPPTSSLVRCGVQGGIQRLLLLRFAGAVLSCGGGLAIASYVRVFFSISTYPACSCRWFFEKK
jgi:hypothetical protein